MISKIFGCIGGGQPSAWGREKDLCGGPKTSGQGRQQEWIQLGALS